MRNPRASAYLPDQVRGGEVKNNETIFILVPDATSPAMCGPMLRLKLVTLKDASPHTDPCLPAIAHALVFRPLSSCDQTGDSKLRERLSIDLRRPTTTYWPSCGISRVPNGKVSIEHPQPQEPELSLTEFLQQFRSLPGATTTACLLLPSSHAHSESRNGRQAELLDYLEAA